MLTDLEPTDLEMLDALSRLDADKLNAQEEEAFPAMLDRLRRGVQKKLTTKQHDWVKSRYLHFDLDADSPAMNLVSSGQVPVPANMPVFPYEKLARPMRPPGRQ